MDNNKGWISLYRSIADNFLWNDKPFAKGQAWIDLLLLANHDDAKTIYKGQVISCKRGTVNRSIESLAERWGWNRKTATRFLRVLENDGMITTNISTHRTTITIVNYEFFQDNGTTKRTAKSQQDGQQSPINNKEDNVNNVIRESTHAEPKRKYGKYQNVLLTEKEFEKLQNEFSDWKSKIEEFSEAMESKGYRYKNHYVTIKRWAARSTNNQGVARYGNCAKQTSKYENIGFHL